MSNLNNVEILEDAQADFDTFLSKYDWRNAQAVIDSLFEQGFEHEATILRKAYLRAQKEWADTSEKISQINERFLNAIESDEPEDPRDVADRRYPRE